MAGTLSSSTLDEVRAGDCVPSHVAIIMDGNGRWARERGLPRTAGHKQGASSAQEVVEGAIEAGISILTLFAFSTENWHRPAREVSALMGLLRGQISRERERLRENGVSVRVLGEVSRLDKKTRASVEELERHTADGQELRVNLMLSYSGRDELVHAARGIAQQVASGTLRPDEIDASTISENLFTRGVPDPDLLIRTSGEYRLSNFLLWQLAYTELYVTPVLWPDFTREDLFDAVLDFQRRDRRFGRVTAS